MIKVLVTIVALALITAASAAQPAVVDLREAGALRELQRTQPEHFRKIQQILAELARQPQLAEGDWLRTHFDARHVALSHSLMKTSNPPKQVLQFTLDDVRYTMYVVRRDVVGEVRPAREAMCTPTADPHCDLALTGTLLVRAVDETRVLVAIDTHEVDATGDGRVDHFFFIVGPKLTHRWPETMERPQPGTISISAGAKTINLSRDGAQTHALSLQNTNWSHFWGYDSRGPLIERLIDAQPAASCDHTAGSCWEVDGFSLNFPS